MEYKLTIYTPIDSGYENLDVIYNSLKNQTNKEFVWLIFDYNNADLGRSYFLKYQKENSIEIQYQHQFFKGRYLVTQHAFKSILSNYILGLDGAYFVVTDCVETILNQWQSIEVEKNHSTAEIRGLAQNSSNELIGSSKYVYQKNLDFVDISWHEMVLKRENYYEMLTCWDREKFLKSVDFNEYNLFSDQVDELSTSLFWSSIGRAYKTRYLNKVLKCKIENQLQQEKKMNFYNTFVSNYYFILQNSTYFFYAPRYYSVVIYLFITSGLKLKLNLKDLYRLNRSFRYRLILMSYYLPVISLKKIKK